MTEQDHKPPFFPIACDVEEGKIYTWCGCGESKNQPFCDKTGCGDKAVQFKAELTETLYFCACKQTRDPPLCDGSHANLLFEYLRKKKKA